MGWKLKAPKGNSISAAICKRAKLRGVTFTIRVKGLVPRNLEEVAFTDGKQNHTATWKPTNRHSQSKNNQRSQSGVNQMPQHHMEVCSTAASPLPPEPSPTLPPRTLFRASTQLASSHPHLLAWLLISFPCLRIWSSALCFSFHDCVP